jgi:transcriptional regulator with XRE-family HTH domain
MKLVKDRRHIVLTTSRAVGLTVAEMAKERAKRIGGRIEERLDELDITQAEVARRMDSVEVTKDYVSRWKRGANEPSEKYLPVLAAALETTVEDLMSGPVADRTLRSVPVEPVSQMDRIEEHLIAIRELLTAMQPREAPAPGPAEVLEGEADRLDEQRQRNDAASSRKRRSRGAS